ncbi:MAG: cytochrome c [Bryobacteraceae bacterium]
MGANWKTILAVLGTAGFATLAVAVTPVTFHKDIEPLLQKRCQTCHRPGEPAPMSLLSYKEARPWAKAMKTAVLTKKMPPWFPDPHFGKFVDDRTLSQEEIGKLVAWADAGAPEGDPKDAPNPLVFTDGWLMGEPDVVIEMPKAFHVPASGKIPYQYIAVATNFKEDRWVASAEIRPGNRAVVHHIQALSIPNSPAFKTRLGESKVGEFLDADAIDRRTIDMTNAVLAGKTTRNQFDSGLTSDYIQGYTPGSVPLDLKPGEAKLIKAGSLILFQLHYTASGKEMTDQSRVGLIFAKEPPKMRIHTVNVQNFAFTIPPEADNYPVVARARLKNDTTIVTLRPHMHFRGKDFEYRAIYPTGASEVLLRIPKWDFNWQMTYTLETPKTLPKGTIIEVVGHFDNTANNPFNPDPKALVVYGEQTWNEMLGGLIDVALDPKSGNVELFETVPEKASSPTGALR